MHRYLIPSLFALATASPLLKVPLLKTIPLHTETGDPSRFTFYDMPTAAAGPCDLCEGPDGALWGEDIFANMIFRINTTTNKVEEYPIPWTTPALPNTSLPNVGGRVAFACAIRPGADGNLYAAQGIRNQLVRINPKTKAIKVITPSPPNPLGNLQPFNDIYTNATGIFFSQTTANLLTYLDYSTGAMTNYNVPGSPLGVFVASDGNVYTTEFVANKIHRLNPHTGATAEFPVPLSVASPAVIRAETKGKYIWFTGFVGDGLGRLELATGEVTPFSFPSPLAFPTEDTVDGQGNVWFSTATQDTLNYYSPRMRAFTSIVQPGVLLAKPVSLPFKFEIAVNYGPGNNIWFTEAANNRVGRYSLD